MKVLKKFTSLTTNENQTKNQNKVAVELLTFLVLSFEVFINKLSISSFCSRIQDRVTTEPSNNSVWTSEPQLEKRIHAL